MKIRVTKGRDGPNVLTCIRADGSRTWAKVQDYFPVHDIAHFVVESTLGIPNAFYSLVLDGSDIGDFAVKGTAKKLPPEANLVEAIVGRLQRDLMPGTDFTVESFNQEVEAVLEGIGNPARRPVTDPELSLMRGKLKDLLAEWKSLPPGASMEMEFSRLSSN